MGLFSHKDRTPEPQVSIYLDEAGTRSTLYPGASVNGTVSVQSSIPRQLLSAHICLYGRVTTHSTRRVTRSTGPGVNNRRTVTIHYHDEAQLFNIDQSLCGTTSLEPEKGTECQFSFVFPGQTGAVAGAPYTRETTQTGVYAAEAHALPPTFSYSNGHESYASVEYMLQVIAHFSEREEPFIHNGPQPLMFCPLQAPHQSGFAEFVRPSEKYSSSRLSGEEKSIGHSFRDKFSSKTPSVNVVVKASVPVSVSMAAGFTMHTCIEICDITHPSINVPSAKISITSLKLLPITAWRGLKVERTGHMFGDSPEHEVVDVETVRLNAVPSEAVVQPRQVEKGDRLAFPSSFEARIPGSVCPSFGTLNINRSYVLKITLEAEVSGKVFEHKFESRVEVLSNLPVQ